MAGGGVALQKDVRKAKASELEHFLMKIDSNSGKY
jgi:hypothetical protein